MITVLILKHSNLSFTDFMKFLVKTGDSDLVRRGAVCLCAVVLGVNYRS